MRCWGLAPLFVAVAVANHAQASQQDESPEKPDLYVFAVQIDTKVLARGEIPNSREARLLAKLATERSRSLYGKVQTRVLFAEQASRENILKGFSWLETTMREQDVAVVFVAGHGLYEEKRRIYTYYPVGGKISGIEFRQAFNRIPGRKVLLLQTCHANAVLETPKGVLPFRKTMVISACDDDEEATRLMGIVMTNGLAKWAADSDGMVTTQSLAKWIDLRVPLLSKGKQHVQITRPPMFTDFPLAPKGDLVDPNLTGQF